MSELKFTSDGKKVVVIGSLNSQEKIVQEIFIVDGSELPSGEHFVVKSLHDTPVISWKEQELKKLNERYDSDRRKFEDEIDILRRRHRQLSQELREKLEYIGKALKNANEDSFKTLVDYITGEIQWVVIGGRGCDLKLLPIKDFNQMYEDKLRLISLFGKDDGTFTYAINTYYDWSGSHTYFSPFKNYDDALSCFKEKLLKNGFSQKSMELAKEYGFSFPQSDIDEWKEKEIATLNKNIEDCNKSIGKWTSLIDSISQIN